MKTLAKFISGKTPKFNKYVVEGLCYHRLKRALDYIDNFIKYSCSSKTNTHLTYLGYKEFSPKEEIKYIFNKSGKIIYDIAENDIYLVDFMFKYGNEEQIRRYQFYIPFMNKGNIITLSSNKFLVMPVLADKVISVGEKIIFINILTAKYNFNRIYYTIMINDTYHRIPLIITELYKNQVKKLDDTTKAIPTVMHYLLANFGYSKTMYMLLGFIPTPIYDYNKLDKVILKSTEIAPKGYIKDKNLYKPTNIKFIVDHDQYNEDVAYAIGNLYYILDNFPESITIDELDNTLTWKRLLGEIIHSGNHKLSYIIEKINAHFNDLNSPFDPITINKLKDVNINCTNLIDLLVIIFKNFNNWILNTESRSLYNNKTYEVESFVLSNITSRITRAVLDINKEELRINGNMLESKVVDKIFNKYFVTKAIFNIKKERQFVTSIEYPGDHLYPKNTSMVVEQESDFINIASNEVNTSERKKLIGSMATVGSILGLSKKNPTPIIRVNPYVNIDFTTGTILLHPEYNNIIEQTDKLLANMVLSDSVDDMDIYDESILSEDDVEDNVDNYEEEFEDNDCLDVDME